MTIFKQHDIRGLVGTLCGACIVTLVALGFSAAPARAQKNFNPLPPQVAFISNGKFTGTLNQGNGPLPITGTIAYLTGQIQYEKISVVPEGTQIISNSWLVETQQSINQWAIVSTSPNTCRQEVLSGASYPQCNAWGRTPRGLYVQKCTVTAQGNKTTFEKAVQLSSDNKLVQYSEYAIVEDENGNSQGNLIQLKDVLTGDVIFVTQALTVTMTSQGTQPPVPSDFNRPSICPPASNVPTDTGNDNSQGNDLGCTSTIPNICF
jgi:hypothetical protein